MKIFESIFGFLYGFTLLQQDWPRLSAGGFEVRIAFLFLPVIFLGILTRAKLWRPTFQAYRPIIVSLFAFLLYLTLHVAFNFHNGRAIGFLLWTYFNAISLFYALLNPQETISKGFFISLLVGVGHMLIQRVDPFFLMPVNRVLNTVDQVSRYRVFSWFGEPSYACLNLIFLFIFLNQKPTRLNQGIVLCVLAALSFTFSKVAILGLGFYYLIQFLFFREFFQESNRKRIFIQIGLATLIFAVSYLFPNRYDNAHPNIAIAEADEKVIFMTEMKTEQKKSVLLFPRWMALRRGSVVISEHPFFGVGYGNSKAYIVQTKPLPTDGDLEGLHNLYQEIWAEIGLFGLILFLYFLLSIWRQFAEVSLQERQLFFAFWFSMLFTMQFCQTLNMPTIWLGLIFSIHIYRSKNGAKNLFA